MLAAETTIRRLALRAGRGGVAERRLRAQQVLAALDLAPAGLPRGALLVVRRLADPLPGRLPLGARAATATGAWEGAVRARVARLAAAAARPAAGAVAADAPAVLFGAASELLACLGRDWLRGELGRWWWRVLFPGGVDEATVARAYREHLGAVPAALERLSRAGDADAFVARLSPARAFALAEVLATDFGLGALRAAVAPGGARAPGGPTGESAPHASVTAAPRAPWSARGPTAAAAALPPEAQLLLGLALTLARAPAEARRPAFAVAAGRWWRAVHAAPQAEAHPVAVPAPPPRAAAIGEEPAPPARDPSPAPTTTGGAALGAADADRAVAPTAPRASGPEAPAIAGSAPDACLQVLPADALAALPAAPRAIPAAGPVDENLLVGPGVHIRTAFGGVFFLVDLALSLGLYGDFTQPMRPGLSLSIWDFLALAGQDLLGPELRADPLWALLAALAGRAPDVEPGAQGRRRSSARGRRRWWASIAPYLRFHLARAVEVEDRVSPGERLCRHAATVEVTDDEVHVSFSLEAHPLAIRRAGLDRDPGWVPAAGRRFFFHFT